MTNEVDRVLAKICNRCGIDKCKRDINECDYAKQAKSDIGKILTEWADKNRRTTGIDLNIDVILFKSFKAMLRDYFGFE